MADARERLTRLIELATENAPDKQQALAFELCDLLVNGTPHPFEQLGHVQEIMRRNSRHVVRNFSEINIQSDEAAPQHERQHRDP